MPQPLANGGYLTRNGTLKSSPPDPRRGLAGASIFEEAGRELQAPAPDVAFRSEKRASTAPDQCCSERCVINYPHTEVLWYQA
jgi:hypothetical protein